jgi:protein-S-isoprenylcysteine O-methyltransferase Ste14
VAGRGLILRRSGKNPFVFGKTDKSDFVLVPAVAFFAYAILASVLSLPFPRVLLTNFFTNHVLAIIGLIICFGSLVWFALTLKAFGQSFRVGIDESTKDKLIVSGTFAISRNPLYLAVLAFIAGMILIHPNLIACIALVFFFAMTHRQIIREERFLKSHYGAEYEEYCRKVRRYF